MRFIAELVEDLGALFLRKAEGTDFGQDMPLLMELLVLILFCPSAYALGYEYFAPNGADFSRFFEKYLTSAFGLHIFALQLWAPIRGKYEV